MADLRTSKKLQSIIGFEHNRNQLQSSKVLANSVDFYEVVSVAFLTDGNSAVNRAGLESTVSTLRVCLLTPLLTTKGTSVYSN